MRKSSLDPGSPSSINVLTNRRSALLPGWNVYHQAHGHTPRGVSHPQTLCRLPQGGSMDDLRRGLCWLSPKQGASTYLSSKMIGRLLQSPSMSRHSTGSGGIRSSRRKKLIQVWNDMRVIESRNGA